ncbi:jg24333 [Pararge aegeria aegeria]|uniref:Jg24333 protein n=1 Tax=Pararge aegeria aegeria TaxID=348720 RepID=A0A8S4SE12_9NEOP|nr:jg24333 [Pararge aegeria aegeria]
MVKTHRTNKTKKFSAHKLGLTEKRQEKRLQSSADTSDYRCINDQISKSQTYDLQRFNTEKIKVAKNPRAKLTRRYPGYLYEISMALKQLKNSKAG